MQSKEGFSLGIYGARASQASHPWVAHTLQLYNYLLRFYLTMPPPLKGLSLILYIFKPQ